MASNGPLSDAIDKIIKSVDVATRKTAFQASQRMVQDLWEKAKSVVDEYYEYKNGSYTKFGRQYNLYDIYEVDTPSTRKHKDGYQINAKIIFYDERLEGVHNGSRKYRPVDGEYVLDLFWSGEHPWYSGSPVNDGSYKTISYGTSAKESFKKFDDRYDDVFLKAYLEDIIVQEIYNSL